MKLNDILFKVSNGVGWIMLNRPEKLNTFSNHMIEKLYSQLLIWKDDPNIAIIVLEGAGDKAFSAGGDVRQLYDLKDSNIVEYAIEAFTREYRMDMTLHLYPKPILVYMDGYVMGGGVGVSVAGSHRIVTEKTKWAMPETSIGLYPDVGASYFMNKMPGHIGRYLALTSKSINAAEALYTGVADYYIESSRWSELRQAIENKIWNIGSVSEELHDIIAEYSEIPAVDCKIQELEEEINRHFSTESVEEIIEYLQGTAAKGSEWAEKTVNTILSKSPTSLKVTLKQLVNGKKKSLKECFMMELNMSINFMKCHDFFEGVRAVLVDKDRAPRWYPAKLEEVKEEAVDSFFTYSWESSQNPLEDFTI